MICVALLAVPSASSIPLAFEHFVRIAPHPNERAPVLETYELELDLDHGTLELLLVTFRDRAARAARLQWEREIARGRYAARRQAPPGT